jgi:hypothetical protein
MLVTAYALEEHASMTVEVFGTDEFQAWFLDLSAEEQAALVKS